MKLHYSQKTENKLKVCPESMLPQKVSEVTIPITNKYGKLRFKTKTSSCRNVVAINIWNTLILKDAAIIKSDILKH